MAIPRKSAYKIGYGGSVDMTNSSDSEPRYMSKPAERVVAAAFDTPVVGWRGKQVNTLRLWSAQPIKPILLEAFLTLGTVAGRCEKATRPKA